MVHLPVKGLESLKWTQYKVIATRGRRQGPIMTQGSGRGISTGQDERPECPIFHKNHYGICRQETGVVSDEETRTI